MDAISPLKSFFKLQDKRILPFWCKLQDLTDTAIPFPGDFVIDFTSNKKILGCWIWRNRDAIATSDFRRIDDFFEIWCLVASGGLDIWVSPKSFWKRTLAGLHFWSFYLTLIFREKFAERLQGCKELCMYVYVVKY